MRNDANELEAGLTSQAGSGPAPVVDADTRDWNLRDDIVRADGTVPGIDRTSSIWGKPAYHSKSEMKRVEILKEVETVNRVLLEALDSIENNHDAARILVYGIADLEAKLAASVQDLRIATALIAQLPSEHEGRNSWMVRYEEDKP